MNTFIKGVKKYQYDIIIIFILLAVCIICLCLFDFSDSKGTYVEIKVDGKVIEHLPLDEDITYTIENSYGYNILVIKDGSAYIKEASCNDKTCVNTHAISNANETIICLPQKVVITIISDLPNDTALDDIAG